MGRIASMKCLFVLIGLLLGLLSLIESQPVDSKNLYKTNPENVIVERMTRGFDDDDEDDDEDDAGDDDETDNDDEADEDDGDKRQFICPHPNMIPPPINLAEVEKQRKY